MSINAPFTVAIAGFGWWGKQFAARLSGHPYIRVAGIVEPMEGNHPAIHEMGLRLWLDLSEPLALDEIDAIILTTPNSLHEAQVIACAKAGKHVFCEKPLGLTAASARRSAAACLDAGVQLGIGHERRFEPAMQALKADIDQGALGTIMHAEAAFSHDKLIHVPANDWRTRRSVAPAAGMTGMGIHLTDLLISFFGPVNMVQAITTDRSLGWETGDVVTAQLQFEAGMTATLSAILHTPLFLRMHVFGSAKWMEIINECHPDEQGGTVNAATSVTGHPITHRRFSWTDTVIRNLEAFAAAVCGEESYPFTMEQIVHNIEVLEAIALAAERRNTVFISEMKG